jgi:hypothetical protein
MGPAEVAHRLTETCRLKLLETQHRLTRPDTDYMSKDILQFSFCSSRARQLPELPWAFEYDKATIDRLLSGSLFVLGHEWTWRPTGSVWHEAPDTHNRWPQVFFGRIPYRQGNPYGDVRVAWEPSRLQQLVLLGLCAQRTGSDIAQRAVELLEAQFLSWVEGNPFLTGIHYISAMECGLRLLAVCYALDLARSKLHLADKVWTTLLSLVHGHAGFITKRLSLHSSAGNHTVAEGAALLHAGLLFPEMRWASKWYALGLSLLEQEAPRQVLRDGGGAEQSAWYLRFISDLYGLVCALLHHHGRPLPALVEECFHRSRTYLEGIAINNGLLPQLGDGDDGCALSPYLRFSSNGAINVSGVKTCADSGYSIIRTDTEIPQKLIFDHGSLGMAPCYAHGHADALSVLFIVNDEEVLIDTGTYTYTGDNAWRQYFRGTRAHNTVVVDALDQAVQETAFMWSHPYRARMIFREEEEGGAITLLARHDGYEKRVGVRHFRALLYHPPNEWLIWDRLVGAGVHQLELNWHVGMHQIKGTESYVVCCANTPVHVSVQGGKTSLRRGEREPIVGWRSSHYGWKEPITTIQTTYTGQLPHEFLTQIRVGDEVGRGHIAWEKLANVRRIADDN